MLHQIFTIRDNKAEFFHPPFFQRTYGEAERNFRQLAHDGKSTISQNPEDFDLYHVGEYDDQTGKIDPIPPKHIIKAVNTIGKN